MDGIINKILSMIEDIQPYIEFDNTSKLLEQEILDSVSVLLLVQEIEDEFNITIEIEEVNGKNFESVLTVSELVKTKLENNIKS